MYLVAFVGKEREHWGQVAAVMNRMGAERVILVVDKEARGFPANEKCGVIEVSSETPMTALKQLLVERLRAVLGNEFDVAVSLASGSGKEHMALLAALLSVPVGVHLVAYTKEGVMFLT